MRILRGLGLGVMATGLLAAAVAPSVLAALAFDPSTRVGVLLGVMVAQAVPLLLFVIGVVLVSSGRRRSIPASSIPASSIPASSIPASSIPASSIPASVNPASKVRDLYIPVIPHACQHPVRIPVEITVNGEPVVVAWICADANCGEQIRSSRWIAHGRGVSRGGWRAEWYVPPESDDE